MLEKKYRVLDSFAGVHPTKNYAVGFSVGKIITIKDWPSEKSLKNHQEAGKIEALPFYFGWTWSDAASIVAIITAVVGAVVCLLN